MCKSCFGVAAITMVAASLFVSCNPKISSSGTASKRNILLIVVDDLKPDVGFYGNTIIVTPSIDRLSADGVTFLNAYCQQAVCAPSRVSTFTGMRPDVTGVWDLNTNMRDVNPGIITLPGHFRTMGYETVGVGKLIHGAKNNDPESWSIPYREDSELVYAEGFEYPVNGKYQSDDIQVAYREASKTGLSWAEANAYLKERGLAPSTEKLDIPDDAYEDGALAEEAIRLINRLGRKSKPFFIAVGFHKPHLPFSAPKQYWDLYEREEIVLHPFQERSEGSPGYAYHTWGELRNYSDIPANGPLPLEKQREIIHGYMASVSYVDAQLGKVLEGLRESGEADNTIIILWGDHGWHLGDHGLWCKHSNFEQATHAPLIISAPGIEGGTRATTMAEFTDIFPTLCDLAGLPAPQGLQGVSLKPALLNPSAQIKDYAISQYPRGNNRMGYSIRSDRYRLTAWFSGEFRNGNTAEKSHLEALELYDYLIDPMETRSLARNDEYSDVRDKLLDQLLNIVNPENGQ